MELVIAVLTSRIGQIGLAGLVSFFIGFYSVPQVDIAAVTRNAEAGRDAMWQGKLIEANEAHEAKLTEAVEAAKAVVAIPADRPSRLRVCAGDPDCRDKGRRQ